MGGPGSQNRAISVCSAVRANSKVRFTWKDYRAGGMTKVMTLDADEFCRFLLHTLPDSFHRIRHYGFLANGARSDCLAIVTAIVRFAKLIPPGGTNHLAPRGLPVNFRRCGS